MTDQDVFAAEIVERQLQPTAAVRIQQPMAELDLAAAFDQYMPAVAKAITEAGASIGGPPYGRYHRFGPDVVDVEIGFPVVDLPAACPPWPGVAAGEVGRSELPGGPVAQTMYRGSYDGLGGVYDRLHEWIHAQPGYDDGAGAWESYISMPGDGPGGEAQTEIVWPLVPE